MSQCPVHNQEFILKPAGVSKRTGKPYSAFYACPTYGCNQRPPKPESAGPVSAQSSTPASSRNFDREAYEKCCSIWAAQQLAFIDNYPNLEYYWKLFQAIRADGQKRFATGMDKARNMLQPTTLGEMKGFQTGETVSKKPAPDMATLMALGSMPDGPDMSVYDNDPEAFQ